MSTVAPPAARYRPAVSTLMSVGVVTTAGSAVGSVLGALPIGTLFTDNRWFIESIGAILVVTVPAMVLRIRATPKAAHLLPGLVLLILYVTTLYLHRGSFGGVLPGSGTWQRIVDLHSDTNSVISNSTTPLHSTAGIRLYVVPAVGLLAALTDWLAVVRRSPALAGIGFLAIFTVVGAVKGSAIGWLQFTVAAVGYLIILAAASRRDATEWGRVVPRVGQTTQRPLRLGASGARIATIAVVLAVAIPSLLPGLGRDVLLDAFHRGTGGDGSGGGGTAISAFADLAGELRRQDPIDLLKVKVSGEQSPFYLRSKVLTQYTPSGWRSGGTRDERTPTPDTLAKSEPEPSPTETYDASFQVLELKDALPFFTAPSRFEGLRKDWGWDVTTGTLSGSLSRHDETYTEQVAAPNPSAEQLRAAPDSKPQPGTNLVPDDVKGIVAGAVVGATNAYDRALAIQDYLSPANGFTYNLQTKTGDTGDALLDFLRQKQGFCQQYAAAMAIMLRVANIPSRVVLGYTHGPLKNGEVTVTSHDAHAWVEAYFEGIGWIPFDPTPLSGSDATRQQPLPWQTASTSPTGPTKTNAEPSANKSASTATGSGATSSTPAAVGSGSNVGLRVPFGFTAAALAVVIVLVLAAIPPGLRRRQRGERYRSARRSARVGPVWQELRATATDAGVAWPPPTTPRQVPGWLQKHGVTHRQPMDDLALATEQELYADPSAHRPAADVDRAIASVRQSRRDLLARLSRPARLKMRFWPSSTMRRH